MYVRRRPTLPRPRDRSTIGAERLNFRVRDGTGCFPLAMAAVTLATHPYRPTRVCVVVGVAKLKWFVFVDANNVVSCALRDSLSNQSSSTHVFCVAC